MEGFKVDQDVEKAAPLVQSIFFSHFLQGISLNNSNALFRYHWDN